MPDRLITKLRAELLGREVLYTLTMEQVPIEARRTTSGVPLVSHARACRDDAHVSMAYHRGSCHSRGPILGTTSIGPGATSRTKSLRLAGAAVTRRLKCRPPQRATGREHHDCSDRRRLRARRRDYQANEFSWEIPAERTCARAGRPCH